MRLSVRGRIIHRLVDDVVKYLSTNPPEWRPNVRQNVGCFKISLNSIIALALYDVVSRYTVDEKEYVRREMHVGYFMRVLRSRLHDEGYVLCKVYRSRNGKKATRRLMLVVCHESAPCLPAMRIWIEPIDTMTLEEIKELVKRYIQINPMDGNTHG